MKPPVVEIVAVVRNDITAAELVRLRDELRARPGLASVHVHIKVPARAGGKGTRR